MFMRQTLLLLMLLSSFGFHSAVLAQSVGNEWINPNQTYFRIPVAETGIYRLTQAFLASKGITGINPQRFQLFHRGKEQAIFVAGESDGSFDVGDYIDFYGRKNDGSQDSRLYRDPNFQLNKHYSLYTDTTAYMLTWTLDNTAGKRTIFTDIPTPPDDPQNPIVYETYQWKRELKVFNDRFTPGQNYPLGSSDKIYISQFDTGEGWSSRIYYGINNEAENHLVFSLPVSQVHTASPNAKAKLKVTLAGASNVAVGLANTSEGLFNVRIGTSATNLVALANNVATQFNYTQNLELTIPFNYLTGSEVFFEFRAIKGNFVIGHVELEYPQTLSLNPTNAYVLSLPENPQSISYVAWATPPANAKVYDLTEVGIEREFKTTLQAGKLYANISNTQISRQLLIDVGQRLSPIGLESVTFQNINPATFDYLIITHPKIRKPAGGYADIVQAYADYRASFQGGSHKPFIANMDMLYNQFNYGEKTPLAIRNFVTWLVRNGNVKYMFIMGLGMTFPDEYSGELSFRKRPVDQTNNLVPVMSFPPSDVFMVEKIDGQGGAEPAIPVGRIGVKSPQEVLNYLDKVKEHEGVPHQLWHKNVIHLVGGRYESEQTAFSQRMNQLKIKAEGQYVGAYVRTTNKRTTGITEIINMSEQVNQGISLMTFFGHSNLTNTDLEIGFCSDNIQGYNNKGKYPLMLVNGCNLGGIFYDSPSNERPTLARDWLYTRDRGALAFVGHTYFGYSNILADYSSRFYDAMFREPALIGRAIGDVMKRGLIGIDASRFDELSTGQQMLLQGDPALKFIKATKPDYHTEDSYLFLTSFDNNAVTALTQSYKLNIAVANMGLTNPQKISLRVKHTYPDGSQYVYEYPNAYNAISYQDTLVVTINAEPNEENYGSHVFEAFVDYNNALDEMNENNNIGILTFFMPSQGVFPTLPQEFSIVNEIPFALTAVTSNGLNEGRDFIFELDTTKTFTSLFKRTAIVPAGVTGSWDITSLLSDNSTDSTVYHWRVNYADAVNDPNTLWGYSSFAYIKNSPEGWTQRHFPQFERNDLHQIERNDAERKWEFEAIKKRIKVRTFGSTNNGDFKTDVYMLYEGVPQVFDVTTLAPNRCGKDVIVCMAFNHITGAPYLVFPAGGCGREPYTSNSYNNTALLAGALNTYLANVNANDYVLFFTVGNINFTTWTTSLKNAFLNIGGSPAIFNTLQQGHPYVILGRKGGSIGTAEEAIPLNVANPTGEAIVMETLLNIPYYEGVISSTRIGPSTGWKEFKHNVGTISPTSTYKVSIYGANLAGVENPAPLFDNVNVASLNLSNIDATDYPYLRLAFQTKDEVNKKAPKQLKNWLVLYNGVPDGIVDMTVVGQSHYVVTPKEEGQNFELEFAFRNLTGLTYTTDSLTVQITQKSLTAFKQETKNIKIKAPLPKDVVRFKHRFFTQGWGGKNEIKVYVNPRLAPERYYENNIQIINFEVIPDNNNPLLEVAFDGKKIMNGEIVSASPLISVQLFDDNRFVNTDKPDKIQVAIKKPGIGQPYEQVDINSPNITWSYQAGKLRLNIKKENLESGIYTLRAQGIDSLGNVAAKDPYQIDFEVVKESTVTNVLPYPNPFSTKTKFVFTLTGDQVPDEMKIQIMTVAGKVVREITQAELGVIRVGNNISEYAWDGTDEYGEKLANGVYLYKVIMKKNGKLIEHRATSTDHAFKHGVGKLYIAR